MADQLNPRRRRLEMPVQADFLSDPKFSPIMRQRGDAGIGQIFILGGFLWRETDNSIKFSDLPEICWHCHLDEASVRETVNVAIKSGLYQSDSVRFWAPYVCREATAFDTRILNLKQFQKPKKNETKTDSDTESVPTWAPSTSQTSQTDQIKSSQSSQELDLPIETDEFPEDLKDLRQFFEPLNQKITTDSRFVNAGWRPLVTYPLVWVSVPQLLQALEQLKEAGLTDVKPVLRKAQCWFEEKKGTTQGRKPGFNVITGWALEQHLKERKAALDAKRSELYLEGAVK